MSASFEIVKIVQEHLESNALISATEVINQLDSETLHFICSDIITLVASFLTEENYANNTNKYLACETILKVIAQQAPKEDVLFELLEVLESVNHDEKFTSVLKALQTVLLRMDHTKTQAIAWVLDVIVQYIEQEISLPNILKGQFSEEMEILIENDPTVQRLLKLYITIFLFLDPIQRCLLKQTRDDSIKIFFIQDFSSKNVITTFLLKLMDGIFAHLNFSFRKEPKSYGRQCAEHLLSLFNKNYPDLYKLLEVIEDRRFLRNLPQKSKNKVEFKNIFYSEERFTTLSVGIVFHLTFVENIHTDVPQVYKHEYIIDKGLTLVNYFLDMTHDQMQRKGIELGLALLCLTTNETLCVNDVDLYTRNLFYDSLSKVIVYSPLENNRKKGIQLFNMFIEKHSLSAKYKIIEHLFNTVSNSGLLSFTAMMYKGLVVQLLNTGSLTQENFSSVKFCKILTTYICQLKEAEQTDLMETHDLIMTALNFLIFLMMRDKNNCTGIFNVIDDIQKNFLEPLERALQLSRAHYANEAKTLKCGEPQNISNLDQSMDVEIQNDLRDGPLELTKEKKLEILLYSSNMFDIITRLLARVNECVDIKNKK